jgi:hypothetical protein
MTTIKKKNTKKTIELDTENTNTNTNTNITKLDVGYIYILLRGDFFFDQNIFKIGKTINDVRRLREYNSQYPESIYLFLIHTNYCSNDEKQLLKIFKTTFELYRYASPSNMAREYFHGDLKEMINIIMSYYKNDKLLVKYNIYPNKKEIKLNIENNIITNNKEGIFIIQKKDHIEHNIFKLCNSIRMDNYLKTFEYGTKIKYAFYCNKSNEHKKILYRQFKKEFNQQMEYGRDYFEGDIKLMKKSIIEYFQT